jgi:hypothetical protein
VAQALATDNNNTDIPTISYNAWISQESSHFHLGTASWEGTMKALVGYLEAIGSPSAALLYAPGDATETYFPGFEGAAKESSVNVYNAPSPRDKSHLKSTLESIRDKKIMTIVVAWDRDDHIQVLADVAGSLGMNSDNHKWIFLDSYLSPQYVGRFNPSLTSTLGRLLKNSRIFQVLDPTVPSGKRHFDDPGGDQKREKFLSAIRVQSGVFVGKVVRGLLHEMTHGDALTFGEKDGGEMETQPTYGTGFLYDSIIAIGIAACGGLDHHEREDHHESEHHSRSGDNQRSLSLAEVDFEGATGRFRIQDGARNPDGLQYQVYVLRKFAFDETFWTSLYDYSVNGEWTLAERVDDLYIPVASRVFGIVLSGTAIIFILVSAVFICRRQNSTAVRMSQPVFLYAVCFGAVLNALAIDFRSFDDSSISDVRVLDTFCYVEVWLIYFGQLIVYMGMLNVYLCDKYQYFEF